MKIVTKSVIFTLLLACSMVGLATAQTGDVLPSADDVVAKMVQLDSGRQAQLNGYTATRHYIVVNKQRRAEMVVAMTCGSDGAKQFTILSEQGSNAIRKHVFYKMLKEETEASRRGTRNSTRITPANYEFQVTGEEAIEGRPSYVLQVTPREDSKYLIDGKIWVDASDYSIVRIEGSPARNPSFWTRSVHFVHTYQKVGPYWFAASTHSVSQVRIFGDAELTIETSSYSLNPPAAARGSNAEYQARLAQ